MSQVKVNASRFSRLPGVAKTSAFCDSLTSSDRSTVEMIVKHCDLQSRVNDPDVVRLVATRHCGGEDVAVLDGILRELDAIRGIVSAIVKARRFPA